jgi:hypothetical protein
MRAIALSIGLLASTAVGAAIKTEGAPEATVAAGSGPARLNRYTNPYPDGSRYRRDRVRPVFVKDVRQDPSGASVGTPKQQAAPAQQASPDDSTAADEEATNGSTADELAIEEPAAEDDTATEESTDGSDNVAIEQSDSNDTTNADETSTTTDATAPVSSGKHKEHTKPKAVIFYATIDDEYKIQKSEDGTFQILIPNPDYNATHKHHSQPPTKTVFDSGEVVGKVELIIDPGTSVTVYGDQFIDDTDAPATSTSDAPDAASTSPTANDTPAQSSPARSTEKSQDGSCGPRNGGTSCLGTIWGNCCSAAGYCGKTAAYCGDGCKTGYGSCGSNDGEVESIPSDIPVKSSPTTSKDAKCGAKNGGQTCTGSEWGDCCSMAGYCGMTNSYCGTGCQEAFGKCDSTADKKFSISVAAPSSDAAAPAPSSKHREYHRPTSNIDDSPISTDAGTPSSSKKHKEHHKPTSNAGDAPISTNTAAPSSSRKHKEHHRSTSSIDNAPISTDAGTPSSSRKHKEYHRPTSNANDAPTSVVVIVSSPSSDTPSPSPDAPSDAGQSSTAPLSVAPPDAGPSSAAATSAAPSDVVSSDPASPSSAQSSAPIDPPTQSSAPAPADASSSAIAPPDSSIPASQSQAAASSSAADQAQASQVPLGKRGESVVNERLVYKDSEPAPALPKMFIPET